MTRQSLGRGILDRLIQDLGDKAVVEFRPRQEGNTLHLILAPPKVQAAQSRQAAEAAAAAAAASAARTAAVPRAIRSSRNRLRSASQVATSS